MAIIDCKKKKFTRAAKFYAKKLGIPDNVYIHIKVKKHIEGQFGYCEYLPEASESLKAFLIVLENGKYEDPLEILAHEMVHVSQYARGDLVDGNGFTTWKGVTHLNVEIGSEEYYFSPCEVEAYGYQVGLVELFRRERELQRGINPTYH